MSDRNDGRALSGLPAVLLGALLTWAAVVVPLVVAGVLTDPPVTTDLLGAALFCVGAVFVPALLALLAARAGRARLIVLVILTLTSLGAGIVVATSDDGQAGFVVILVSVLAIGLAAVFALARLFVSRRS